MNDGGGGNSRTCGLRQPPEGAQRFAAAHHHPLAKEIHKQRADLGCCVQRPGMRERPKQRIDFVAVGLGDGLARGVGVRKSHTASRCRQSVPKVALKSGVVGTGDRGFNGHRKVTGAGRDRVGGEGRRVVSVGCRIARGDVVVGGHLGLRR